MFWEEIQSIHTFYGSETLFISLFLSFLWTMRPSEKNRSGGETESQSGRKNSIHPENMKNNDEHWMERCLQLAQNGSEGAAPNPLVGAVIVHDGRIIGEGFHAQCGQAHAEVNAIA